MEYTDIFRQLIQIEARARAIQDQAQAFGAGMTAELQKIVESHRRRAYEKAETQIAQVEEAAIQRAGAQIASLEEEARRHRNRLRKMEAHQQQHWVRQIYLAAICKS